MTKGPRRTQELKIWWDNPPGPDQGVTIEVPGGGELRIPADGLVTAVEAAHLLGVTTERIYQLVAEGKLRERGSAIRRIRLADVKRLTFSR